MQLQATGSSALASDFSGGRCACVCERETERKQRGKLSSKTLSHEMNEASIKARKTEMKIRGGKKSKTEALTEIVQLFESKAVKEKDNLAFQNAK